jgi:putative exporter of polyketide antibiotics
LVVFLVVFLDDFFAFFAAAMALITSFQSPNVVAANFRVNVFLVVQAIFPRAIRTAIRGLAPKVMPCERQSGV